MLRNRPLKEEFSSEFGDGGSKGYFNSGFDSTVDIRKCIGLLFTGLDR